MILYRAIVENANEHFDDPSLFVRYQEFQVIRETPAFYIIKVNGKDRKVGKKSKAQFASSSKDKALMNAFYRNKRHRSILNARISYAKKVRDFLNEQM